MKKVLIAAASAALHTGCAITTEGTLTEPLQEKPDTVCIINNPAVAIGKVNTILQQSLQARGVNSVVCATLDDCKSPWHMTYVLTRRWDMVPYLAGGHMELYKDGTRVSAVDFSGGWGFNFAKWGHSREKIDGMVGALLGEQVN